MSVPFYKYQGTGNDFVIIDDRQQQLAMPLDQLAPRLCMRKFGIGADGLIVLQNHREYDFEMRYFNADGSQSLCGNGSRCAIHLAQKLGVIQYQTTFLTTDGPHEAYIKADSIHLKMHDVAQLQRVGKDYFVDNGSPHYVKFVDELAPIAVSQVGPTICHSAPFGKGGTNVNFVQQQADNALWVRTYERGVEDETLSCGTGAVAVALAATERGYKSPISIHTQGGRLEVHFESTPSHGFQNIYLVGPARMVFQGTIDTQAVDKEGHTSTQA